MDHDDEKRKKNHETKLIYNRECLQGFKPQDRHLRMQDYMEVSVPAVIAYICISNSK